MKYAIVLADWPMQMLPNAGLDQEWKALAGRVSPVLAAHPSAISSVNPGAWVVPLGADGFRALAALTAAIDGGDQESWGYRVLVTDQEPAWAQSRPTRQ